MTNTVEKSCWSVTLWAVVAVMAAIFITSIFSGSNTATSASIATVDQKG